MFVLRVASAVLLGFVGLVALSMAWKGLSARRLLPFHQAGTGRAWDDLSRGERSVAAALTRSLGLGFLAAGLALLAAGVTAVVGEDVATYGLAGVGGVFCAGLAVINRRLTLDTSVGTPWKQSLYAVVAILAALALYAIG
jgi:hypothetical protein